MIHNIRFFTGKSKKKVTPRKESDTILQEVIMTFHLLNHYKGHYYHLKAGTQSGEKILEYGDIKEL